MVLSKGSSCDTMVATKNLTYLKCHLQKHKHSSRDYFLCAVFLRLADATEWKSHWTCVLGWKSTTLNWQTLGNDINDKLEQFLQLSCIVKNCTMTELKHMNDWLVEVILCVMKKLKLYNIKTKNFTGKLNKN